MQDTASTVDGFDRQLTDYGVWSTTLARALESYREWCGSYRRLDSEQELNLLELVEELRGDAVTIALVGEFSRGKTELINAIFFSDYDRRLLPSTPGRTTMCPTEIRYDIKIPPCIRLLPIETRKSAMSISELKHKAVNWTTLPLELDSPEAMAKTLKQILRSKKIDKRQAHELGLDGMVSELPSGEVHVEVPVWRHAIVNYPHRLLEQGLVVLDTPGLNALGAEPELTLGMLPNAHAILFVLAADTGVTRTDMEIWRKHVCPATGRNPENRLAALNKVDTLWDELESPDRTQGFIDRQVERTHKMLQISRDKVFPVSARKGLIGKIRKGDELVARSGLRALERTLSTIAVKNRQKMICEKVASEIGLVVQESEELIRYKIENLETELEELRQLDNKSVDLIDEMSTKLRKQKNTYDAEVQSFNVTRRLLSEQVRKMTSLLSMTRFDQLIAKTRYAMNNSWTTPGVRQGMETFFGGTFADLKRVEARSEKIRRLVEQIYNRFHGEYGLPIHKPVRFSTKPFMRQYQSLHEEAEAFRTSKAMMMSEQYFVVKKFFIVLVSRARVIFEDCNGATRYWAKAVLMPIYKGIREHKDLIDRRLDNLDKLRNNHAALRQREQKIVTELKNLHKQAKFIDSILASIQQSASPHFSPGSRAMAQDGCR